jgi:DHA1 family bicyclomycin/chloramphenicol resistance-like MFS transporter
MKITKKQLLSLPGITIVLALLTAMAPLGIDSYLSSIPDMAKDFGVPINEVELTLTIYFLGFAIGNFLGGPASDAFGRKTIAISGILIYLISALLIPLAGSIQLVWFLRATQSIGGGFATVTPMLFIRDWFEGKKVAKLATIISMIMMFAPLLAPIVGTGIAYYFGWKSIFFFLSIYASIIALIVIFLIPESRPQNMITNCISTKEFVGKYKMLFSKAPAVYILLAIGLSMAGMYVFITAGSFIYLDYFGFSADFFPILYGANVMMNLLLSLLNNQLLKKYSIQTVFRAGVSIQLAAGVLLFFSTWQNPSSFIFVFIGIVLFVGSIGMIFGNGTGILLNLVPELSGSANAMIGLTRFLFGSIAGSLVAYFHTGHLFPVGIFMLLCAALASFFFFLYQYNSKESYAMATVKVKK